MSLNRRYIASLAAAAVLTLVVGLVVKRQLRVEPTAAAPSEAAALQQLSREGQVRRLSSYFDERIAVVGAFVEWVPDAGAAGIRWRTGDTLITTTSERPIVALRRASGDTALVAAIATSDSLRGQWALLVGRSPTGMLISTVGFVGGRTPLRCGGQDIAEYVVGAPLHDGLAGAGLFDVDGRLRGVVARCAGRLAAIPVSSVVRLLDDRSSLGSRLLSMLGVVVTPLDTAGRTYFDADSGLLVARVRRGSPADRAGWAPGDVIVHIGSTTGDRPLAPETLVAITESDSVEVTVLRDGRRRPTHPTLAADTTGATSRSTGTAPLGIDVDRPAATGVPIDEVQTGSAAQAAGLRPGDRLLRVGGSVVSTPAAARRALQSVMQSRQPTFIILERDTLRIGVFIRP